MLVWTPFPQVFMELAEARNRAMDRTKPRAFLYRPDEAPLMVYEHEVTEWKLKGWRESPADFIDMKKHAAEIGLPQKEVEAAYASVKRDVNEKINIHTMNATELADFCTRKSDGKIYNRRLGKAALLEVAERIVQGEIIVGVDDMDDIEVFEDDDSAEDNSEGVQ